MAEKRPAGRGQIGIEYFLIMGFALTVVGVLIANSERQLYENDKLDAAVLSMSAMNAVGNSANIVFLQGNGSSMRSSVFIPRGATCFILRTSGGYPALACDIGDMTATPPRMAYGMSMYSWPGIIDSRCYTMAGWMDVVINNSGSANPVGIYCRPLA